MKKVLTLIVAIFVFSWGLSVAVPPARAASPVKPSGELRIGCSSLLTETLRPYQGPPARRIYSDVMYDNLLGFSADLRTDTSSGLAYKFEEAPDHMSWTFYLRDGVKFHDGSPVTLEDVKFSLDQTHNPKNSYGLPVWKKYIKRNEIIPPNKVVMHVNEPWTMMEYYNSAGGEEGVRIQPKKYIEEKGEAFFERQPIGSGPYKFVEKREGDYIKFEALDNHWLTGTPKYKYITFKLMPEEGTRVAALKRGEVDIIETTIARAKELEDAGFKIKEKPDSGDLVLVFNRTWRSDNPLSKKEVREALVLAIDKASILKHILMGRGKLVGHGNYLFTTSLALVGYPPYPLTPYDPKKAKQLLASAGYPNGFTIYFYSFQTFLPEQKLVNEAIVGYWKAVGMDVKILEMDYGAFRPIFLKQREPAGPAAHTFAWPSKLTGDWNILSSAEGRDGGMGFGQVGDPVLDQLIEKMRAQNKKEDYIKAERKCGERVMEQYFNTVIASFGTLFGVHKNVPDWNIGMDGYAYRFHTIGSSKAVK